MKNEEYVADFILVSKRTLDEQEYQLFRFHFVLGADWKLCCRRLNIDRGLFFHAVYRIQQKLGRTFRELEPHALFPLDEYFGGCAKTPVQISEFQVQTESAPKAKQIARFPVKRAA